MQSKFGILWTYDGERFLPAARHGLPTAFAEFPSRPIELADAAALGDIARGRSFVHVADLASSATHSENPLRRATVDLGGARTALCVPLHKGDALLGIFVIYRKEVRSFSDKQIALLQSLAAQAVIAMENARLFEEVQARTRDLAESLEQQTATSEVLSAISSSLFELAPLFQKILENAIRVCGAKFGNLNLYDGERFDVVASCNLPREYAETQLNEPLVPHPKSGLGTVAVTHRPVRIEDLRTEQPYREGDSAAVALSDVAGVRTLAIVPMLNDEKLVGTIAIFRQEVNRFSEKQIALLSNFAKQAVIGRKSPAAKGIARVASAADRNVRSAAGHQFIARRSGSRVREDAGERDARLRRGVWSDDLG